MDKLISNVGALLPGRVAVITGAAQGLGFSMAETFVAQGAKVIVTDLDLAKATAACEELGGGDLALPIAGDVRNVNDVQAAIDLAVTRFGRLDVMVNNAGITRDSSMRKMSEDQFQLVIDVHLKGAWNGTRLAAAHMRENGGGSIVNVSSISGKVGMFGQTNYSAAKAGIVGLTKAAAKETASSGIRVNAVQPGLIRTAMTEAMSDQAWQQKLSEIPLGRPGEPSEVASVVLFLASDLSSYMTGTVLEIAGGRFM